MPELPEVETLRLQLTPLIADRIIKNIEILSKGSFIGPKDLVLGAKIIKARRLGKILIFDLDNDLLLAVHLKMTGQVLYKRANNKKQITELPNNHTRVIIFFANGDKLFFNDIRKFGWMKIIQRTNSRYKQQASEIEGLDNLVGNLGPDPLKDLTPAEFEKILKSSKRAVKLVLMDQTRIAGVGNIYANEALFYAEINPQKPADKISKAHMHKLLKCLKQVLTDGIKWKGSSKRHFRDIFGRKGQAQKYLLVYDREGEECPNKCGGKIKRIRLGGRGTYFCPRCQAHSTR